MCFAIDEDVIMDEDEFMLNYAFTLFDTAYMMVLRGVDTFWMKKESQFQKRIYWELMNTIFFAFPTVFVNVIGEDPIENPDILDIKTNGAFDDVRIIEKADIVISYIDSRDTCACAMVEDAQANGKEIIDLKKAAEDNIRLEKEVRQFRVLKRKKEISEIGSDEFRGFNFK